MHQALHTSTTQSNALLTLIAETSLHAGAGSSIDSIDLPIMREGHTGYPCVFSSAVKGALRCKTETEGKHDFLSRDDMVKIIFGPKPKDDKSENPSEHAGALNVGDARLLLFPMRSLTGQFKLVTSPYLLKRLKRDAERLGLTQTIAFDIPEFSKDEKEANQSAFALNAQPQLYLEEYRFTAKSHGTLEKIVKSLNSLLGNEFEETLRQQLVIVSDDIFSHFATYATPVAAHIAIQSDTKTVKDGALWYEETLPPETVLYVALNANRSRWIDASRKELDLTSKPVLECITKNLFNNTQPSYLQLGGNETVGMGWCRVFATEA